MVLWLIHLFVLEQNGKWKALKSPVIEMPVSKNSDWLSRVRIGKKTSFEKYARSAKADSFYQ